MDRIQELDRDILAVRCDIEANKALLTAGAISEAERIAIRSQIVADTQRLTELERRMELRLQQQSSK
jgi:hypothetical protein